MNKRSEKFFCNEKNISYFLDLSMALFNECPQNCLACNSISECIECKDNSHFLKFTDFQKISCPSCFANYNCSSCYFGNSSFVVDYELLRKFLTLIEFRLEQTLNNWDLLCLSCPETFFLNQSKCFSCSDLIPYCTNCSYKENNNQLECFSCTNNKIVKFTNGIPESCISCPISDCLLCSYSQKIINKLKFAFTLDPYSLDSLNLLIISCYECNVGYGFGDDSQQTCLQCPYNCDYCYEIKTQMFCGRCKDNYVLNIYSGKCQTLSEYTNITTEYSKECLKIVSENPWSNEIYSSSIFLCQKCKNINYYPSIFGFCITNHMNCLEFFEGIYSFGSLLVNLTELLLKKPLFLINYIKNETLANVVTKCLGCQNNDFFFDNFLQICCSHFSFQNNYNTFSSCQKCKKYSQDNFTLNFFCSNCESCSELKNSHLLNDNYIKNVTISSPFYGKKIYYLLMKQYKNFNENQILNDFQAYMNLYQKLNFQKAFNYEYNNDFLCLSCPINSIDCINNNDNIESLMKSLNSIFYPQLGYFSKSLGCKIGFVFDFDLKRCKFCPNNWTACYTYKEIKIKFLSSSNINFYSSDNNSISNLNELEIFLKNLETGEFSFIMNEFAVKSIKIIIELDTSADLFFVYKKFDFSFESNLKSKIPSLQNYNLYFQPINYTTNEFSRVRMHLGCSMSFSGFNSIIFFNIDFSVSNYFINEKNISYQIDNLKTFIPGFYFEDLTEIIISNCKIKMSDINSIKIINLIMSRNSDYQNVTLNSNFIFYFEVKNSGSLTIKNLEIFSLTETLWDFSHEIYKKIYSLPIFNLNLNETSLYAINISNSKLNRKFFQLESIKDVRLSEILVKNLYLNGSNFFSLNTICDIYIDKISFIDLTIVEESLFILSKSSKVMISNHYFSDCSFIAFSNIIIDFHINSIYQISTLIDINNLDFYGCNFSHFYVAYLDQSDLSYFKKNSMTIKFFHLEECIFFGSHNQKSFGFSFVFSSNSETILQISNISLANNHANYDNIYFLYIEFSILVNMTNISIKDNFFSGILLESIDQIFLKNILYTNTFEIHMIYNQNPFAISNLKTLLEVKYFYFENMVFPNSGFLITDRIYDNDFSRILTFQNLYFTNITIKTFSRISAGIYIDTVNFYAISIYDCNFFNIFVSSEEKNFAEASTSFMINSAFSNVSISFCNFVNNSGNSQIIYAKINQLKIFQWNVGYSNYFDEKNISMLNNEVITARGAVGNLNIRLFSLENSIFHQCSASNGGAFYFFIKNYIKIYVEIKNCIFSKIFAINEGGGFYFDAASVTNLSLKILNSSFENILSLLYSGGVFNLLYTPMAYVEIINCNFSKIYSGEKGGLISAFLATILFSNSLIFDNVILFKDLPFYFKDKLNLKTVLSSFQSNLIDLTYCAFSMTFCKFSNLQILDQDIKEIGLINCAFNCLNTSFENILFSEYFFYISRSSVNFNSCNFLNISAFNVSNKMFASIFDSSFIMTMSVLKNSQMLFICAIRSLINIRLSYFANNTAENSPILFLNDSFLNKDLAAISLIIDCIFENNRALYDAGCIMILNCFVQIKNNLFFNNSAIGNGGAIFFSGNTPSVTLNLINNNFTENSALSGGGIYYQNITINLEHNIFFKNNALSGKNIFSYPRKIKLMNCSNIVDQYDSKFFVLKKRWK